MGSENAHRCTQNAENDLGFDFLEWWHEDGEEYLNHIIWVISVETWISFVNIDANRDYIEKWLKYMYTYFLYNVFSASLHLFMAAYWSYFLSKLHTVHYQCNTMETKKYYLEKCLWSSY
jgi:hypothetical protein